MMMMTVSLYACCLKLIWQRFLKFSVQTCIALLIIISEHTCHDQDNHSGHDVNHCDYDEYGDHENWVWPVGLYCLIYVNMMIIIVMIISMVNVMINDGDHYVDLFLSWSELCDVCVMALLHTPVKIWGFWGKDGDDEMRLIELLIIMLMKLRVEP